MKIKKRYIFVVLLVLIAIGFLLFYKEGTMAINKNSKESKIIVIEKGESLNGVIKKLASENLIRNRIVFYLVVKQLGYEKKIQAGEFRISPAMDAFTIASQLTKGTQDIWVTVIEGLRKEEIAEVIAQSLPISEIQFVEQAKEGYLFPDTYLFPKNATIDAIIATMTKNYQLKITSEIKNQFAANKLTENETIILASLVEREAKLPDDKGKVASILLKRYRNDWPLQLDATIQYALGFQKFQKTWWKTTLSTQDLDLNSPFNTYKNKGLPPAPICNPGIDSIKAVAQANDSIPYWYYLSDKGGKMHYAVTLEEHNSNIEKYLN